jgi:hypothetical protein
MSLGRRVRKTRQVFGTLSMRQLADAVPWYLKCARRLSSSGKQVTYKQRANFDTANTRRHSSSQGKAGL